MFELKFDCKNSWFLDSLSGEEVDLFMVADAIHKVAERVNDGEYSGAIKDGNGNVVGIFGFVGK